jgi:hypothetical protein
VLLLHEESRPFVQVHDETISIPIMNQTCARPDIPASTWALATGALTKANDYRVENLEASWLKRRTAGPAKMWPERTSQRNPIV